MRFLIALFSILLLAAPATAQERPSANGGPTALQLIQTCAKGAESGTVVDPTCIGYMSGFVGAIRIAVTVSSDFPICLPEKGLSNTEMVSLYTNYLEKHEDLLQRSARSVMFLLFTERFPCSGN